ncbi:MAG: PHP domain-containing protein, partial [Candidatus Omnitrophica bacterium]|nr:PHP domain-containing protein [Candidatus Omnitrophota bacterium]
KRHHLILLVKNEQGYKNLVKLVTIAHLEGFYYKPRIDEELLDRGIEKRLLSPYLLICTTLAGGKPLKQVEEAIE